ncbi:MAG: Ig-like domain-containing protein, partial [Bacteroidota bacterium]
ILDQNGDGILNTDESAGNDLDGDGITNGIDFEFNAQGGLDQSQTNWRDSDGDLIPDYLDLDSDNDGISDLTESGNANLDTNGNGFLDAGDTNGADTDNDGLADGVDNENGEPGSANNTHGNEIDTDSDGQPDYLDLDADNDSIADVIEGGNAAADTNQDGVINSLDTNGGDADGDGFADAVDGSNDHGATAGTQADEPDTDNDSTGDWVDLDSDNDSIFDLIEVGNAGLDTDNNGFLNADDTDGGDADADGLDDNIDTIMGWGAATSTQDPSKSDFDNDGQANYVDLDADDDGISDLTERYANLTNSGAVDTNNDGMVDGNDSDLDGIIDSVDGLSGFGTNTGLPNLPANSDSDPNPDYLDIDADNDGIVDNNEAMPTDGVGNPADDYIAPQNLDADKDGIDAAYDVDDSVFGGGFTFIPENTDGEDLPDYLDLNTDNDLEDDTIEGHDFDNDGNPDVVAGGGDADADGLFDNYDNNTNSPDPTNSGTKPSDYPNLQAPATAEADWRELINPRPIVIDDFNNTFMGIQVTGSVLTNDYDPDGSAIEVAGFATMQGGPFSNSITIPGQGTLTLFDASAGTYTFVPVSNFYGQVDPIYYQTCDPNGGCATGSLVIEIIEDTTVNRPPIANNDHYENPFQTILEGNIYSNDFDPDEEDLTWGSALSNGTSINGGVYSINTTDGSFVYLPPTGFSGLDTLLTYDVCDPQNNCDAAVVTVWVNEQTSTSNYPPTGTDDGYLVYQNATLNGAWMMDNDPDDPDGDPITVTAINGQSMNGMGTVFFTAMGGELVVNPNGYFEYTPDEDYFGPDQFIYTICDDQGNCDQATVYLTVIPGICLDIQVAVFLEGPFDVASGEMHTLMNTARKILPGQTPVNPLVTGTPAGNPYRGEPWLYEGTTAEETFAGPYDAGVVDWVLVSFRTGTGATTTVAQGNGLLYADGHVEFIEPCILRKGQVEEVYIVVEHRNHMGVMSDTLVSITTDNELIHDFRQTESYRTTTSFGQKQVEPGTYVMFAGDGDQGADFPSYDINGLDNIIWTTQNGFFDTYLVSDYNMNGDVNGGDIILWTFNNGISSAVPKN